MIVISIAGCKSCEKVKEYLDSKDIEYDEVDLSEKSNREARRHYRDSGYRLLPVIECNGWVVEGCNIELLEEYING